MNPKVIEVPGMGNVEFPGDMSDEAISAAIKANMGPQAPAYKPKLPAPPDVNSSGLGAFLTRLGTKVADLPGGIARSIVPVDAANQIYQTGKSLVETGKLPPEPPFAERVGSQLGIDTQAVKEDAETRNWGGLAAETTMPIAQVLALGKLGRKTGITEKVPLTRAEAVESVKNAVNPPPQTAPKYSETLKQQMGNIINHAESQGVKITDRASMADVMKQASDSYRQKYYGYLKPVENETVTPPQSYQGSLTGSYPHPYTTLGAMESRLTEINATLNPAYEKGGGANISSQAAVSAEAKSALRTEANAIRSQLYSEIAKRNNVPVEDVALARNNMGALNWLAEKTQKALNVEEYSANKQANQPISLETSASGFGLSQAEKFINRVMGKKADRTTASVFRQR